MPSAQRTILIDRPAAASGNPHEWTTGRLSTFTVGTFAALWRTCQPAVRPWFLEMGRAEEYRQPAIRGR